MVRTLILTPHRSIVPFPPNKLSLKTMGENWSDLLRLFSSIRRGNVPASLILSKLAAYPRQNRLALTLREMGRLEIFEQNRKPKPSSPSFITH